MQALATAALNPDAYVFTKKNTKWKDESIWENIEYPWLTRNLRIKRIWRVDPRPPDVKGIKPEEDCEYAKKELLWERGRDATIKPDFVCPVTTTMSLSSSSTTTTQQIATTLAV